MRYLGAFVISLCIASAARAQAIVAPGMQPLYQASPVSINVGAPNTYFIPTQQPPLAAEPSPTMRVHEQQPVAPKVPDLTAAEQGYTAKDQGPSQWEQETMKQMGNSRQKGEITQATARQNGVGTQVSETKWVSAWEGRLTSLGVSPNKIHFEARRLTKTEFSFWASRQVLAVEDGLVKP